MAFSIFPNGKVEPLSENKENRIFSPEQVAKLPSSHTMHLNNLPPGVTELGIRNMCSNYGEVLHVLHIHRRARLVTYKSPQ